MEKIKCPQDGQLNEIKVSSGFNKPENKGKKYFTCIECENFYWVENGEAVDPRTGGLKVDESQYDKPNSPFKRKPVTQTNGYKKFEAVGAAIKDEVNQPDWDVINIRKNASYMSGAFRSQGQSPREAMELGHFWEWMDLVCFDLKGYQEWKKEAIEVVYNNEPQEVTEAPKKTKVEQEDEEMVNEFLNEVE